MSVLSCSREDCDNIMCDTYVQSVGYICYECKSEFKNYLQQKGLNPKTEGQIRRELAIFMDTPKDTYVEGNETTIDEFFNENTQ